MTTHAEFYAHVPTEASLQPRLQMFLEEHRAHRAAQGRPLDVLDVGCGDHAVLAGHLEEGDRYHASDVKPSIKAPIEDYRPVDLNEGDLPGTWEGRRFDVVFCGEVMEHVFSPDRLLRQLAAVMHRDSLLLLSTPNLAYWLNRVLLLAGITPAFVENSAEVQLGRRFKVLGQGRTTQGHVRLFTVPAAHELFARERFELLRTRPYVAWNLPVDRVVARFSPRLAPGNVFVLRKPDAPAAG
jgi:SAM-dependent methyltransferase